MGKNVKQMGQRSHGEKLHYLQSRTEKNMGQGISMDVIGSSRGDCAYRM